MAKQVYLEGVPGVVSSIVWLVTVAWLPVNYVKPNTLTWFANEIFSYGSRSSVRECASRLNILPCSYRGLHRLCKARFSQKGKLLSGSSYVRSMEPQPVAHILRITQVAD